MNRKTKAAVLAAAVFLTGTGVFATPSAPARVDADLRSSHWTTAFTNVVNLAWDWKAGVTHVELEIVGMGGTFATNFTEVTSNYLWRTFASNAPSSEDVYTLTLTVYTNGNGIAEVKTASLAVLAGAFGVTAVNADSGSPAWSKVKGNAVIPYAASFSDAATNAATAQLVIAKENGRVQTNAFADVAGYAGWKLRNSGWGYGLFDLALTFPGTAAEALTAELMRPLDGTAVSVR